MCVGSDVCFGFAPLQVHGYIRQMVRGLEGSKGGTLVGGRTKFFTAAKADTRRYADYKEAMVREQNPVLCSSVKVFAAVWKEHSEIVISDQ